MEEKKYDVSDSIALEALNQEKQNVLNKKSLLPYVGELTTKILKETEGFFKEEYKRQIDPKITQYVELLQKEPVFVVDLENPVGEPDVYIKRGDKRVKKRDDFILNFDLIVNESLKNCLHPQVAQTLAAEYASMKTSYLSKLTLENQNTISSEKIKHFNNEILSARNLYASELTGRKPEKFNEMITKLTDSVNSLAITNDQKKVLFQKIKTGFTIPAANDSMDIYAKDNNVIALDSILSHLSDNEQKLYINKFTEEKNRKTALVEDIYDKNSDNYILKDKIFENYFSAIFNNDEPNQADKFIEQIAGHDDIRKEFEKTKETFTKLAIEKPIVDYKKPRDLLEYKQSLTEKYKKDPKAIEYMTTYVDELLNQSFFSPVDYLKKVSPVWDNPAKVDKDGNTYYDLPDVHIINNRQVDLTHRQMNTDFLFSKDEIHSFQKKILDLPKEKRYNKFLQLMNNYSEVPETSKKIVNQLLLDPTTSGELSMFAGVTAYSSPIIQKRFSEAWNHDLSTNSGLKGEAPNIKDINAAIMGNSTIKKLDRYLVSRNIPSHNIDGIVNTIRVMSQYSLYNKGLDGVDIVDYNETNKQVNEYINDVYVIGNKNDFHFKNLANNKKLTKDVVDKTNYIFNTIKLKRFINLYVEESKEDKYNVLNTLKWNPVVESQIRNFSGKDEMSEKAVLKLFQEIIPKQLIYEEDTKGNVVVGFRLQNSFHPLINEEREIVKYSRQEFLSQDTKWFESYARETNVGGLEPLEYEKRAYESRKLRTRPVNELDEVI